MLPLWVAKEGGYFAKHCVNVGSLQLVAGGAKTAQAIISGADQFGTVSDTEVLDAAGRGGDLVVTGVMDVKPFVWIYAKNNITSIKQLKGKTLDIVSTGSLTDYAMQEAVKAAGLTYKDFTVESLGSQPASAAALISGQVQAAALVPPFTLKLDKQGFHSIFGPNDIPQSDLIQAQNLVSTKQFIQQHPTVALHVEQAYLDGIKRMESDKAFDIQVIEKYTKVNQATATGVYNTFVSNGIYASVPPIKAVSSLQTQLRLLQQTNPKLKVPNISSYVDNALVQQAAAANVAGK